MKKLILLAAVLAVTALAVPGPIGAWWICDPDSYPDCIDDCSEVGPPSPGCHFDCRDHYCEWSPVDW